MAPLETENEAKYKDQGFHVLGFYSNDFGNQGGDPKACADTVGLGPGGLTFPQFVIDHVIGDQKRPVFEWLLDQNGKPAPTWNFHKYLIARDGTIVGDWDTGVTVGDQLNTPNTVETNELAPYIEAELAKPKPQF
jgi:glutathione peroxidase